MEGEEEVQEEVEMEVDYDERAGMDREEVEKVDY